MPKSRSAIAVPVLLVVAILALPGCGTQKAPAKPTSEVKRAQQIQQVPVEGGGSYTDVSAACLAVMLQNKDFTLINVHIPYEGEIEGTDLFIPYNEVEANLDRLPADKDARLVVYCRSGSMSAIASRTLVGLGYTNVWNLDGGMIAWGQSGYPLVDKGS
jgi:rhodanese-related sulfurtransferase